MSLTLTTDMKEVPDGFEFLLKEHMKQSRPSYKVPSVVLKAFPTDSSLCVVTYLREYLKRTKPLRGSQTRLFISCIKPYKQVLRETFSRWIRSVMRPLVSILKCSNRTALELQQPQKLKQHVFLSMTYCVMLDGHPPGVLTCFTISQWIEPSNFVSAILQID